MRVKAEGKILIRKLTVEDIPEVDVDFLDGANLVAEGYYKVSLESAPSLYVYMKTFGGLDPEDPSFDLSPYAYIDRCGFLGDYLHIDTAEIENRDNINVPKTIEVQYIQDVSGENAKIFRAKEGGQYYMRVSSYPREKFARWITVHKKPGYWEEGNNIRPNITFVMGEASETVKSSTWNGAAIYSDQFDVRFEH